MKHIRKTTTAAVLCLALLFACLLPVPVCAEGESGVDFLSYEEALEYFDLTRAATNWCNAFGWNAATRLEEAKEAILAGTDPRLIIGLATLTRDLDYGFEKLVVTNAFRPACYQETIGLHDSNTNIGPFRNALLWNGRGVVNDWWNAEKAPGWPKDYTVDLTGYDLNTLDLRYLYRFGLQLWDNTWAGGYYAKPGGSGHNSGCAMDVSNWWLAANFKTVFTSTVNGKTLNMTDYGIDKPLQPSATSAGEEWHITCDTNAVGMENYDGAFARGYEAVWGTYFNPVDRGWTMADGRGIYIGAGVLCLQVRLFQLGLLEKDYITGYFCHTTTEAVKAYQTRMGLESDGVCGPGTMAELMKEDPPAPDSEKPVMVSASRKETVKGGFILSLNASDNAGVRGYRVETRPEGEGLSSVRYYNALSDGKGEVTVDVRCEGAYDVSVRAVDAAGNESDPMVLGDVFADMSGPVLRRIEISDITADGFALYCQAEDYSGTESITLRLTPEEGEKTELTFAPDDPGPWEIPSPGPGSYTVTVIGKDVPGYTTEHVFRWRFDPAQAEKYKGVTLVSLAPQ